MSREKFLKEKAKKVNVINIKDSRESSVEIIKKTTDGEVVEETEIKKECVVEKDCPDCVGKGCVECNGTGRITTLIENESVDIKNLVAKHGRRKGKR